MIEEGGSPGLETDRIPHLRDMRPDVNIFGVT